MFGHGPEARGAPIVERATSAVPTTRAGQRDAHRVGSPPDPRLILVSTIPQPTRSRHDPPSLNPGLRGRHALVPLRHPLCSQSLPIAGRIRLPAGAASTAVPGSPTGDSLRFPRLLGAGRLDRQGSAAGQAGFHPRIDPQAADATGNRSGRVCRVRRPDAEGVRDGGGCATGVDGFARQAPNPVSVGVAGGATDVSRRPSRRGSNCTSCEYVFLSRAKTPSSRNKGWLMSGPSVSTT
jgi:hypothetical protein